MLEHLYPVWVLHSSVLTKHVQIWIYSLVQSKETGYDNLVVFKVWNIEYRWEEQALFRFSFLSRPQKQLSGRMTDSTAALISTRTAFSSALVILPTEQNVKIQQLMDLLVPAALTLHENKERELKKAANHWTVTQQSCKPTSDLD